MKREKEREGERERGRERGTEGKREGGKERERERGGGERLILASAAGMITNGGDRVGPRGFRSTKMIRKLKT